MSDEWFGSNLEILSMQDKRIRSRFGFLLSVASLAGSILGVAPAAEAKYVGTNGFDYVIHDSGWGGGYAVQASFRTEMSGLISEQGTAFAAGSLYAGEWASGPLAAVAVYAERAYGWPRARAYAEALGRTVVDEVFTSEIPPVMFPIRGVAASKRFSILGVTFDASAYAGGVVGIRNMRPILGSAMIGAAAEPFLAVGARAAVAVNSAIASFDAWGEFDIVDLSLPSSMLLNLSNGFYYIDSDFDINLVQGGLHASGRVLFIPATFVDFHIPTLYSESIDVIEKSGFI
jgi:hypothetical protein